MNTPNIKKRTQRSVVLEESIIGAIRSAAEKDRRGFNKELNFLLEKALKDLGYEELL